VASPSVHGSFIRYTSPVYPGASGNRLESRDDLDVLAELALGVNSLNDFGEIPSGPASLRYLAP